MKNINILGSGKSIECKHVILALTSTKATDNIIFPTMKTYKASHKSRSLAWGVKVISTEGKHLHYYDFSFKLTLLTPTFILYCSLWFAVRGISRKRRQKSPGKLFPDHLVLHADIKHSSILEVDSILLWRTRWIYSIACCVCTEVKYCFGKSGKPATPYQLIQF